MATKDFGWTGIQVPVVGQGTWEIEGAQDVERRAVEALRTGLELGLTHIDTAEMYGSGRAEEITGKAIEGRRKDIFLVSKVLPNNASYEGTLRACERSLRRLRTDYLDLYLLHWESSHPIGETMRAMEHLIDSKLIRHAGVSNFDMAQVAEAQQSMRNHRLACNQVLYHLQERGIERRLIPYCQSHGIAVVGYTPFGKGKFPRPDSKGGKVLAAIAARHGKTVRQVILNFLTRLEGVFTIPKSGNVEHTKENAGGAGWSLEAADMAEIDSAFPAPMRDTPLAMI